MAISKLERIDVVVDGRLKASFSDGSLILLPSDAESYFEIRSNGDFERHLTKYALRCHAKKLAEVLRFRNLYYTDSFYSTWVLEDVKTVRGVRWSEERTVQWPATVEEGLEKRLIQVNADCVVVSSEDGYSRLAYDAIGERVSVRTPLQLSSTDWILEDKVHPISRCSEIWSHPLSLAIRAQNRGSFVQDSESYVGSRLLEDKTPITTNPFPTDSWWRRRTTVFPKSEIVVMVWTPDVFFQRFQEGTVHAWITLDESYLVLKQNGRYLTHSRRQPKHQTVYSIDALPNSITAQTGEVMYSLISFAETCLALRRQTSESIEIRSAPLKTSSFSVEVKEERRDRDGVFTAYEDGRVRVRFSDRTILNMDQRQEKCELVLANGKTICVRCDCPCGVETYVQMAKDFATLTRRTSVERMELQRQLLAAEEAAFKSRVNAELYSWIASRDSSVPLSFDSTSNNAF